MKFNLVRHLVLGALFVFFASTICGCNGQKNKLAKFNGYYEVGDYAECSEFLEKQFRKRKKPAGEDLLWQLQAGSVKRLEGDHQASTIFFDRAEEHLKYFDLHQSEILDGIGATAINDNVISYLGTEYDGVMVNTYKALNFIAENKMGLARVEFNRALDRQRRAKVKFNKEIADLQSAIDASNTNKKGAAVRRSVDNPEVQSILNRNYPDLSAFEVYPDFVNPFTTYMAGLFFNLNGDYAKGVDLTKEACGMVPRNKFVAMDLAEVENAMASNEKIEGVCWVIFENGLGPVKEVWRLDLPVFLYDNHVKYVGIALPRLLFRERAYRHLVIAAGGNEYQTEMIADMERVVWTEFQKEYPAILTRAIISATIKAAAQYAMQKQQDSQTAGWASIAMAAYSYATTTADVRMWTALPKEFQIARFDIPEDGKFVIAGPKNRGENFALNIELGHCRNALVYVKIVNAGAGPVYHVIEF